MMKESGKKRANLLLSSHTMLNVFRGLLRFTFLQQALAWPSQHRLRTIPYSTTRLQYGALSMPLEELTGHLGGTGRAKLVWDCYRNGIDPSVYFRQSERDVAVEALFAGMRRTQRLGETSLALLDELNGGMGLEESLGELGSVVVSQDGTTKFIVKFRDATAVESVIIPWEGARSTLCISSQVGCRQGCKFCATGKMGRVRSLSSDEIMLQMFYARKLCRERAIPPVSNVVFMGMGEVRI